MCNKCVLKYYKQTDVFNTHQTTFTTSSTSETESSTPKSPPSIELPGVKCAPTSHAYCVLCKRPGPKLIVVSLTLIVNTYIKHDILLPQGSRCCPVHVAQNELTQDSLEMLKSFNNHTFVNRSTLKGLLDKLKSKLAKQSTQRCLDFDCGSMRDEDFESLTEVNRAAFDEICSNISHIVRNTPARTLRNSVGMFLFKMRSDFLIEF